MEKKEGRWMVQEVQLRKTFPTNPYSSVQFMILLIY